MLKEKREHNSLKKRSYLVSEIAKVMEETGQWDKLTSSMLNNTDSSLYSAIRTYHSGNFHGIFSSAKKKCNPKLKEIVGPYVHLCVQEKRFLDFDELAQNSGEDVINALAEKGIENAERCKSIIKELYQNTFNELCQAESAGENSISTKLERIKKSVYISKYAGNSYRRNCGKAFGMYLHQCNTAGHLLHFSELADINGGTNIIDALKKVGVGNSSKALDRVERFYPDAFKNLYKPEAIENYFEKHSKAGKMRAKLENLLAESAEKIEKGRRIRFRL